MVTLEPESRGSRVSRVGREIVFLRSFRALRKRPPPPLIGSPSLLRTLICMTPSATELMGDKDDVRLANLFIADLNDWSHVAETSTPSNVGRFS